MPETPLVLPPDQMVQTSLIRVPERYRRIMGDLEALADSINTYGMIDPIIVTQDYELRHGGRRLEAARLLRLREVPVRFYREDVDPLIVERESQIREDYRPSEKVALANAILAKLGDGRSDRNEADRVAGSRHAVATREAGFDSQATFRRARKVVARGTQRLVQAMDAGDIAIAGASKIADLPPAQQEKAIDLMAEGCGVDRALEGATGHRPPPDAGDAFEGPEPEAPPGDGELRDLTGKVVPYRLRDAFRSPILADAARLLGAMMLKLQSVHLWNPYLPLGSIKQCLETAQGLIAAARPHAVCPACKGILEAMAHCKVCRAAGFLDENSHAEQVI